MIAGLMERAQAVAVRGVTQFHAEHVLELAIAGANAAIIEAQRQR
jgi:hypothetical protein